MRPCQMSGVVQLSGYGDYGPVADDSEVQDILHPRDEGSGVPSGLSSQAGLVQGLRPGVLMRMRCTQMQRREGAGQPCISTLIVSHRSLCTVCDGD